MKVVHNKVSQSKLFETLSDLSSIAEYVRTRYDSNKFTCKEICEGLSEMYSNLVPVEIDLILFNGRLKRKGHWVVQVANSPYLIDPVGDKFDCESAIRLKRQVAPWLYLRSDNEPDHYFSMNHFPYKLMPEFPIKNPSDAELLRIMRYPFYKQLKCVIL